MVYNACDVAASHGHLDCLKFLHLNGYTWNIENIKLKYYIFNCREYIIENSIPNFLKNKYLKIFKNIYIYVVF